MENRINIKLISIAMLILISVGCSNKDKKSELAALKQQATEIQAKIKKLETEINGDTSEIGREIGIQTIEAVPQLFEHFVEVQGSVDGDQNIIVSPRAVGNIIKINVKKGDVVRKDQILADIDADVLLQSIKELKVSLDYVTELYNKQKALWEQKIGSEVQYLTAKNNKESLEYKLNTLKEQLDMYKIKSPIDGTIEDAPLKIGQSVAPGMIAFRVVNFSTVKIVADVAENYGGVIKKNNEVIVSFPDINKEYKANISFRSRYINPINRTFNVEVKLEEKEDDFFANMIAVLKIKDYASDSAIAMPVNIIQKDTDGNYVYMSKDNKAEKRRVVLGKIYNGTVEILEGINAGERVISVGLDNLEDGLRVIEQ